MGPPLGPENPPSPESFSPMFAVPPMSVVTGIKIVSVIRVLAGRRPRWNAGKRAAKLLEAIIEPTVRPGAGTFLNEASQETNPSRQG